MSNLEAQGTVREWMGCSASFAVCEAGWPKGFSRSGSLMGTKDEALYNKHVAAV